jgi:hypothetical protein
MGWSLTRPSGWSVRTLAVVLPVLRSSIVGLRGRLQFRHRDIFDAQVVTGFPRLTLARSVLVWHICRQRLTLPLKRAVPKDVQSLTHMLGNVGQFMRQRVKDVPFGSSPDLDFPRLVKRLTAAIVLDIGHFH